MEATVNTTPKFEFWWREHGQFIHPADIATPEELKTLHHFASRVFEDYEDKLSSAEFEKEELESDLGDSKFQLRNFIEKVRTISEQEYKSPEKLIADLVELLKKQD